MTDFSTWPSAPSCKPSGSPGHPWPQSLLSPARRDLGRHLWVLTGASPLRPARQVPLNFSWIFPDTCPYVGRPTCPQPDLPLPRSPSTLLPQGTHRLPPLGGPLPSGLLMSPRTGPSSPPAQDGAGTWQHPRSCVDPQHLCRSVQGPASTSH